MAWEDFNPAFIPKKTATDERDSFAVFDPFSFIRPLR